MKNIGLTVNVTAGTARVKLRGGGHQDVATGTSFTSPIALSVGCLGNGTKYTLLLDGKPLAKVTGNQGGQPKLTVTGSPVTGKVIQGSISKKGNRYRVKAVRVAINTNHRPPLCGGIIVG